MESINKLIFTSAPTSAEKACNEINEFLNIGKFGGWIGEGIGAYDLEVSYEEAAKGFREHRIIFVRHICHATLAIETTEDENFMEQIKEAVLSLAKEMPKDQCLSVQTRISARKRLAFGKGAVNVAISDMLEATGYNIEVKNPQQVISIIIGEEKTYIGFSNVVDNLSNWAGGECKYRREDMTISRAEYKLMEAIEVFDLDIEGFENGIDLGAAPGGWTKVLAEYYMDVIAVDPAKLDERVLKMKGVKHYKGLAQDFVKTVEGQNKYFDIIVNDMKMDVRESVDLMVMLSDYLSKKGVCVLTLKLPKKKQQKIVKSAMARLEENFEIAGARQLHHNRSEITVILKRKK